MKTDQALSIPFALGTLNIQHGTLMGDLRGFFDLGNLYRVKDGKPSIEVGSWLKLTGTKAFIETVTEDIGRPALVTGKGRGNRMKAHLFVMLDAAAYLSPEFKLEVYKTFVEARICELRDNGGDLFIQLHESLSAHAESVLGKPAHKGHFITIAKIIKQRCDVEDWNTAPAQSHAKRVRIEDRIGSLLRLGLVRDWDHLKELVSQA